MTQTLKALTALAVTAVCGSIAQAQTTWIGGDADWNNPANWDAGVPAAGIPAVIGAGTNVIYSTPMAAPNFGGLTLASPLTISAAGFNIDAAGGVPLTISSNGLNIVSGGVVVVTNSDGSAINTGGIIALEAGGALIVTNNTGNFAFGQNGNNAGAGFTNNGGTVVLDQPFQLRGRYSRFQMNGGSLDLRAGGGIFESSNDNERGWRINGGTANLGDFSVSRTVHTIGSGFVISNGVVNATSLQIGNSASRASATVAGGVLTNSGAFTINDRPNAATSNNRRVFFYIAGGSVYSTVAEGIIVGNQSNAAAAAASIMGGFLEVSSGLLVAEGLTLIKDTSLQNVHASLTLSGSGEIYLGSVGLVGNIGVADTTSYTVNLNGGTLGAKADYTIAADGTVGGDLTVKVADQANAPHNITLDGIWGGSGSVTKTGGGTLTFNQANTYSGATTVSQGTLAFGAAGGVNSAVITVDAGATLDVSAGGYSVKANQTVAGLGTVTGALVVPASGNLSPAGSSAAGKLTFASGLTISGDANLRFDLSDDPTGISEVNDQLDITGDLNLSGANNIIVTPLTGVLGVGTYTLIKFSGSLVGDISSLSAPAGELVNPPGSGEIRLVVSTVRPAANVVWTGDGGLNAWDTAGSSNWLNGVAKDAFFTGDTARFTSVGSSNPIVNVTGFVSPAAVVVDSTTDYTFEGPGSISGTTGLTKTNSGKLTINSPNDYLGITTISGGTVSISTWANGGAVSPLGAASPLPSNLVLDGGALEYTGGDQSTDRGATLGQAGGTLAVTAATLTVSGSLTGTGSLTKTGDGQLTLTGINDYIGGTVIQSGTIRANPAATLGTNALFMTGQASPATFRFSADAQTLASPLVVIGTNNFIALGGNDTVTAIGGSGTLIVTGTDANNFTVAGYMSDFTGRIALDSAGILRLHPSTGSAAAIFDLGMGTGLLNNRNGGTTNYVGALVGGPSTRVQGGSNDDANDRPTTYMIGGSNLDTLFEGSIQEAAPLRKANLVKVGTGTLTLSGASTYTGYTVVSNGVLKLLDNGSIDNSVSIRVSSPGMLDVSHRVDGTLNIGLGAEAQLLTGSGTILGSVTHNGNGVINPGNEIGTLTVTNVLTINGPVVMELNRATAEKNDKLVAGSFVVSATLTVTNVGPDLANGDTFQLFPTGVSGFLVELPQTDSTATAVYTWDDKIAIDGSIQLLSGGLPPVNTNPTNMTFAVVGGQMTISWPEDYTGWRLQSQTNALSVGLSPVWHDVAGSTATNRVDVPIGTANGTVFFRLVYP